MTAGDEATRYKALFDAPTATELEAQFHAIVGDSFEAIPPAMGEVFKSVESLSVNTAARNICDGSLTASMTIDQVNFKQPARTFTPAHQWLLRAPADHPRVLLPTRRDLLPRPERRPKFGHICEEDRVQITQGGSSNTRVSHTKNSVDACVRLLHRSSGIGRCNTTIRTYVTHKSTHCSFLNSEYAPLVYSWPQDSL